MKIFIITFTAFVTAISSGYTMSLKEAISSLYDALENKLLDDPLNNPKYYNIKTMQKINLK